MEGTAARHAFVVCAMAVLLAGCRQPIDLDASSPGDVPPSERPPPSAARAIAVGGPAGEPDPLRGLRARIVAVPDAAPYGQRFTYVVELSNPTATTVRLADDCPLTSGSFGNDGTVSVERAYLNCEAVPQLEPGRSARFVMQLRTPSAAFGGEGGSLPTLGWRLNGLESVRASVPLQPVASVSLRRSAVATAVTTVALLAGAKVAAIGLRARRRRRRAGRVRMVLRAAGR